VNHSVTCYPSPGKAKARMLCEAFAGGCKGRVADYRVLLSGPAFFYGVVAATYPLWKRVSDEGRDWYYADNSYFDRGRQAYYRVTRNKLQISDLSPPDFKRLDALGVKVKPWRTEGSHVVVCEQSDAFMKLCGYGSGWLDKTVAELRLYTDRPLRIRRWCRDKGKMMLSLREDLNGAWALVTHMSAASNEALTQGVPVFITGRCAASPMSSGPLSAIEKPLLRDGVLEWAAGLAANQWTVDELKSGKCWRDLNGSQ